MAKLVVNTRELKNEDTFRELKNEVIEILKKQDEREVKKAIEFFSAQENRYTHLEKSITGKWIEKAGYGIGTVRIWKGKKFKKIAPNKWVRIYEKEGRGTSIAIGKLISQVKKIDNVEDLMNFVMANKQRFVDENGIDLPILDKLRAAVDEKNNGGSSEKKGTVTGSKTVKTDKHTDWINNQLTELLKQGYSNKEALERAKKDYEAYNPKNIRNKKDQEQADAVKDFLDKWEERYIGEKNKPASEETKRMMNDGMGFSMNDSESKKEKKNDKEAALKEVEDAIDNAGDYDDIEELEKERQKLLKETGKDKKPETKRNSIPAFTAVDKVVEKDPIAKATYVADGKAEIPATREVKNEIKQIMKNVSKKETHPELQNVYYDGENLVATDAKGIKIIKIGELGGIGADSYVKFDMSGKDNIKVEKITVDTGHNRFPNYKRVIPDSNNQKVTIDNRAFKDKIDEMLEDGSIDRDLNAISLEIKDGKILLDGDVVGSAKGVKFDDDRDFINFNYKYILNSITGNESYLMLSDDPNRPAVISTSVSDNIFMPMANSVSKVNYENNRETKKLNDKVAAENKAKNEAEKADREKRAMKGDAKKELIAERPEGVSDSDYSDLIDFADDFYTKLGYDNTSPRAKADIKKILNEAISGVQNKDFGYLDRISTVDNRIARKVFETITGIKLGSNSASAKTAWEKWVGAEAVKKHNDEIKAREQAEKDRIAAEKKAQEDSDNAQYNGFLSGKTAAGKGKAKQILSKKAGFDGKVMSYQEMADHYINNLGGRASSHEYLTASGNKKMTYGIYDKDGRGYEVPKIVYDYAMHISNNNINKSITDLILMADYAHEEFEDEEEQEEEDSFNDFSAENPDLFNSTSYKVREAMCRCGVL